MAPRRAGSHISPYSAASARPGPSRRGSTLTQKFASALTAFETLLLSLWVVGFLAHLVTILADLVIRQFRGTSTTRKVLSCIIIVAAIEFLVPFIGTLTGPVASVERCLHVHRTAYAQAYNTAENSLHRSFERDIDIINCPSAAIGDYGPCLRNSLVHSQRKGRVTYDAKDTMKFFLKYRPRLLEPRPRSSIFNVLTSDKPSFNVSRLSPTQREGLVLWSKCSYPPFAQTLTQPLNLSCPFQAFNLLFFHNTLGDGQMFLPTESINHDTPPKHINRNLQDALTVSIPQEDAVDRFFTRRILHIGATPLLKMTSLVIEHTPHKLAKTLSQLLHEMLHVTQYIYTCPICYSDRCGAVDHPVVGGLRYRQMWLPLTVAIDLMLAKERVLEIPGVNWKEHRLNLHADRVAAAMKDTTIIIQMELESNGEEMDSWENLELSWRFQGRLIDMALDGDLNSSFPALRPDPAPFVVA